MIPERGLTLAEIGAMVGSMHGDEPWRYTARLANIKNLIRVGAVPNGAKGRGTTPRYGVDDIWLIVFASELHAVGLSPADIAPIVKAHGSRFIHQVMRFEEMSVDLPVHRRSVTLVLDGARIAAAARHYLMSLPAPKPVAGIPVTARPLHAGNTVTADDHRRIEEAASFLKH